jgi:hypothetical protein
MSRAARREPLQEQLALAIQNQDMNSAEADFQPKDILAPRSTYSLVLLVDYVDQAGWRWGRHLGAPASRVVELVVGAATSRRNGRARLRHGLRCVIGVGLGRCAQCPW